MHRTTRSARTAAALALAGGLVAAATLVVPGAAFAGTTEPTPATTTSPSTASPTTATTTSPTTASDPTTSTDSSSSTTTAPATIAPTTTATTAEAPTTTSATTPAKPGSSVTPGVVAGGDSARYGLKAAAALPATSTDPTLVGAGFIERELTAQGHRMTISIPDVGTFDDLGLTLDSILALDAAGAGQNEATASTQYVADHVGDYIGTSFGQLYAGSVAKTLLTAVAQGVDPTAFGGVDLVASLESLETPSGRFSDDAGGSDYSNLIGQSLAVLALQRAGETPSVDAVAIIRANQCSDGGFSLSFGASPCTSDPDVTAFAVQALISAGGVSDTDAQQGLDYLAGRQGPDGGVGGAGPTAQENANSTGLAGQAFLAGGRAAQARAAQTYLLALQYGCDDPAALRGGIAYNAEAKAAATVPTDQDHRSTAQAVLALAGTPLSAVSATGADATAPDLACAAPTTSTTTTSSSSTSTSAAPSATGGSGGDPATDPASGVPGSLAFTGADVAGMVVLALLLLVAGAGALVLARRKGAHA